MYRIIVLALLCVVAQAAFAPPSCSDVWDVLDDLGGAQGLTTLNDKYPLPTSTEQQVKRCVEMSEAIKTLRKYNKECFSSLTQQVLSAILRTRSQFNEARCADAASEEFKVANEASKCAAESADSIREAERKTILTFQVLNEAAIPDEKLRVRRACCAVLEGRKLFLDASKVKCAKHEPTLAAYVDSYTQEAMGLICPEASKLECEKLEAIKIDGVTPKTKFFLTPMVKLIKTLDH